jgi:hypothetical protein
VAVYLLEGKTRNPVEATLLAELTEADIKEVDRSWSAFLRENFHTLSESIEHAHWCMGR